MKVLVVEPGYAPYEKDIEGLHGMQEVVGGTITAIYPFAEPVAVVTISLLFGISSTNGMPRTRARRYALYFATRECLASAFPLVPLMVISATKMAACV